MLRGPTHPHPEPEWPRAAQRWVQEWATRKKERRIRRRERREQQDEEYRLRKQQGLSPRRPRSTRCREIEKKKIATWGRPPERWDLVPPRREPQRRQRSKRPGRVRKRLLLGSMWKRCRAPRKRPEAL
jgi:hypothetical protein